MELYTRHYSPGTSGTTPLVILHGLFGNQGNWAWHARELAAHHDVYVMDLRNHGQSGWDATHDYPTMADDVVATLDQLGLERVDVLGHSMGGKVAMAMALRASQRVGRLIVVDIAPVTYPDTPYMPLKAMRAVPLDSIGSRTEADRYMVEYLSSGVVREFLLTNLQRAEGDGFQWRCNLEAIAAGFDSIRGFPAFKCSHDGPVLFIKGSESDYVIGAYRDKIASLFPAAELKIIDKAGHWLHSEKPRAFLRVVRDFLGDPDEDGAEPGDA